VTKGDGRSWWACVECGLAWAERDDATVRAFLAEAYGISDDEVSQEDVDIESSACPTCGWISGVRSVAAELVP
jgi:hypothetical protein